MIHESPKYEIALSDQDRPRVLLAGGPGAFYTTLHMKAAESAVSAVCVT